MIISLVLILLLVIFMAFFIGLNLSNACTFWFFKTYTDLPVAVLALIAFGAGIIFALLFILVAKMRAPASDAEVRAQKKLEKKAKAEEKLRLAKEKQAEKEASKEAKKKPAVVEQAADSIETSVIPNLGSGTEKQGKGAV